MTIDTAAHLAHEIAALADDMNRRGIGANNCLGGMKNFRERVLSAALIVLLQADRQESDVLHS